MSCLNVFIYSEMNITLLHLQQRPVPNKRQSMKILVNSMVMLFLISYHRFYCHGNQYYYGNLNVSKVCTQAIYSTMRDHIFALTVKLQR